MVIDDVLDVSLDLLGNWWVVALSLHMSWRHRQELNEDRLPLQIAIHGFGFLCEGEMVELTIHYGCTGYSGSISIGKVEFCS